MHGLSCDRCGKSLLVDEEVRYLARIEVVAAYDPPELTRRDLETDFDAEIRRLVRAMEGRDAKSLEEEVAAIRRFDLCPPCRGTFLAALPASSPDPGGSG
jgi:ribosomal protein S27AE